MAEDERHRQVESRVARGVVVPRILVIDDDELYQGQVSQLLEQADFEVITAKDGRLGLLRLRLDQPDLVMVDLHIRGLSGLDVCRRIKDASTLPVIALIPPGDDDSVFRAIDAGVDDYVIKNFTRELLVTRVRAVLRRYNGSTASADAAERRACPYTLDARSMTARTKEWSAKLTPSEFRILSILMTHQGRPVSVEQLADQLWGDEYRGERAQYVSTLKTHISHLRKKLRMVEDHPGFIQATRGGRYILT